MTDFEDEEQTSLRAVVECPCGGRCLMAGFPGLRTGIDGTAYMDPDHLAATLDRIFETGARLLILLAEEKELPQKSFAMVADRAATIGLELAFLPIPDFNVPDDDMIRRWHDLLATRSDLPTRGGTVAFACQYGAGRSGLMAAYVLLQCGMALEDAVATVRDHFAEAIESEIQMTWLTEVSARLKVNASPLDVD
jgi:protein-tyrosine phosphatase